MCTSWKVHRPKFDKETDNPRNFKLLNYKAVIGGNVTAPQNYMFRKSHDYRIPFGMSALKSSGAQISLPEEQFTYGRPNRPQTPIDGIIRNNFGESAGHNLQDRYKSLKQYKNVNKPRCNNIEIRYTKAKMKAEEFIKT